MTLFQASMSLMSIKAVLGDISEPINVLLSLAYIGGDTYDFLVTYRHMMIRVILDSGAWSFVSGVAKHLSLDGLISYLQEHGHRFDIYFNFDTDLAITGSATTSQTKLRWSKRGSSRFRLFTTFLTWRSITM